MLFQQKLSLSECCSAVWTEEGSVAGPLKPGKARTSTGPCLGDLGSLCSLPHPEEETSLWRAVGLLWGRLDSPLGPGSPSSPVGPRYPGGPRAPG